MFIIKNFTKDATRNEDGLYEAMKNLKPSSLKLYLYILFQSENEFILSPKDVSEKCGIGITTVFSAENELYEKGYLKYRKTDGCYTFSAQPHIILPIDIN